jgi:hypothetical protein
MLVAATISLESGFSEAKAERQIPQVLSSRYLLLLF